MLCAGNVCVSVQEAPVFIYTHCCTYVHKTHMSESHNTFTASSPAVHIIRVGQNCIHTPYIHRIYMVLADLTIIHIHALLYIYIGLARTIYIRCIYGILAGNHQIYGYIRCIYTVLANPTCIHKYTNHSVTPSLLTSCLLNL